MVQAVLRHPQQQIYVFVVRQCFYAATYLLFFPKFSLNVKFVIVLCILYAS